MTASFYGFGFSVIRTINHKDRRMVEVFKEERNMVCGPKKQACI